MSGSRAKFPKRFLLRIFQFSGPVANCFLNAAAVSRKKVAEYFRDKDGGANFTDITTIPHNGISKKIFIKRPLFDRVFFFYTEHFPLKSYIEYEYDFYSFK